MKNTVIRAVIVSQLLLIGCHAEASWFKKLKDSAVTTLRKGWNETKKAGKKAIDALTPKAKQFAGQAAQEAKKQAGKVAKVAGKELERQAGVAAKAAGQQAQKAVAQTLVTGKPLEAVRGAAAEGKARAAKHLAEQRRELKKLPVRLQREVEERVAQGLGIEEAMKQVRREVEGAIKPKERLKPMREVARPAVPPALMPEALDEEELEELLEDMPEAEEMRGIEYPE